MRARFKPMLLALLAGSIVLMCGCAGTPENEAQPWNRPAGWEHGMPDTPQRR